MKTKNVLRILAIVFAMVLMLAIASCDLFKPEETTPETTTPQNTEHVHTEESIPAVAPTCTTTGKTAGKKCSECGEILVPQMDIAVVGHTWDAGKVTVAPTCVAAGEVTYTCEAEGCGATETKEIPATGEHTPGEAATCTTAQTCTVCNEVLVAALGHTPGEAANCTTAQTCTVCNEVLAAALGHSYQRDVANNEQRFNATWGVCTECDFVEAKHEHILENGKCKYCEAVPFTMEVTSIFDMDNDSKGDVFTMANMLPEMFRAEGVLHINAKVDSLTTVDHGEYDEAKGGDATKLPYAHFYVSDGNKENSYLLYKVTAPKAGVYDLAIHIRLKDARYREAAILVNGEKQVEYSYGWSNDSSAALDDTTKKLWSNDFLIGTYVYGFQVTLKEGENEIKITAPGQTAKTQHIRDMFFAYNACASGEHSYKRDVANNPQRFNATWGVCTDCGFVEEKHEHILENGKCKYCEAVPFTMEVTSIFDMNNDSKGDVFTMANMLPEQFRAEGALHINAKVDSLTTVDHGEYDEAKGGDATKLPYAHFYVSDGNKENSYLLYKVTAPKAGVYDLAIHIRLKDARYREAAILVNGEKQVEYSYGWSNDSSAALDDTTKKLWSNDFLIGTYVYGFQVTLKEGENEIKITAPGQTAKTQHIRDMFFVWTQCINGEHSYQKDVANNEQRFNATWGVCTECGYVEEKHEHILEDGKCKYCEATPNTMEVTSIFDMDQDTKGDVFTMANMLPEQFREDYVLHINAKVDSLTTVDHGEYDEAKGGDATKLPYAHFYVSDGNKENSYLLYKVTAPKAGVYDLAIHIRLKDARYREAAILVNGEKQVEYSYGWSNDSSAALDDTTKKLWSNDFLIGTYVYGFQVTLKEGENEIKITAPGQTAKTQHIRDMFFAWNCEANNQHYVVDGVCVVCGFEHATCEFSTRPDVYTPATCMEAGCRIYSCATCGAVKETTVKALGHKAGDDGVCVNCKAYEQYELVWNDNQAAKVNTQKPPQSFYAINGWSVANWIDRESLPEGSLLVVTGGVWVYPEMLKDKNVNNARPARFAGPVTKVMDDSFWNGHITLAILVNSGSKSSIQVWTPIENAVVSDHRHSYTVVETIVPTCTEAGKWELTCECGDKTYETVNALGHTHPENLVAGSKCEVCGEACEYPAINTFANDIVTIAPVLPEAFKNAISVSAQDAWANPNNTRGNDYIYYDEVVNTSGGQRFSNPDPFVSVYLAGNEGAKIEFIVNVPETGVYDFAIHTRLASATQRGNKITVNGGTENERVLDFDFLLSAIDVAMVRDHDNTKSAYIYGASLKLNLVAGPNTVTFSAITDEIWQSGDVSDSVYIRHLYFTKTGEWTAPHEHTWSAEPTETKEATCTEAGYKAYKCTACNVVKTETIAAKGHVKGDLILSNDPTCISQRENIYDCTACDEVIVELNATGDNARLNHTLDADNKCTTCGVQFTAIDLKWTLGKEWDNKDIHNMYVMKDSTINASSTAVFTNAEIPVGSIIKVAKGYDGKIDGWDVTRRDIDNANPARVGRCDISTFAARPYWADKGAEFTTQLDPTLGARYAYYYFTVKREDGKAMTAEELATALVVLVPTK